MPSNRNRPKNYFLRCMVKLFPMSNGDALREGRASWRNIVASDPHVHLLRKMCHDTRAKIVRSGEPPENKVEKFSLLCSRLGYIRG
jgi:hypothetical protein